MEGRPGGLLPVGLVAFGAVVYSLLPGGGPNPRTSQGSVAPSPLTQSRAATPPYLNEDPLQILEDFLETQSGKASRPPPTPTNLSARLDEFVHKSPVKAGPSAPNREI